MRDESATRLKKFLTDQEESVQLARSTLEGSNPAKIDALNVALSLAHANAVACDRPTTMAELLADASVAEEFLRSE